MKAIKKLKIIWRIAMLSAIIPFLYFAINKSTFENPVSEPLFIFLVIFFILFIGSFFKKKGIGSKEYYEDYTNVSFYYFYGLVFIFLAIIISIMTIMDLEYMLSLQFLLGSMALSVTWILGILLIYYTYQAKKEFSSKKRLKK